MLISTKKVLVKNDHFCLSGEVIQGKLNLELQVFTNNMFTGNQQVIKRFSKLVLLGHRDDLRSYFNNVQALVEHLKRQENYKIDIRRGAISLKEGKIKIELDEKDIIGVSDFYHETDTRSKQEHIQPITTKDIEQQRIIDTSNYSFEKSDQKSKRRQRKSQHSFTDKELKTDRSREKGNAIEVTKKLVEFQVKCKMLEQQVRSNRQFIHQCLKRIQNLQKQVLTTNANHLPTNFFHLPFSIPDEDRFISYHVDTYEKKISRQRRKKQIVKKQTQQKQNSIEIESDQSESLSNHQWIDYDTYSIKYIKIEANRITSTTQNRIAVFAQKILEQKDEIRIQIVKKKGIIGLGICNSIYKNSPQILQKSQLILLQSSGEVRCLGKYEKDEKGLWTTLRGQENVISMRVCLKQQKIQWKIDKRLILAIQNCHVLKQKSREWSLFLFLHGKDDSVDIIY